MTLLNSGWDQSFEQTLFSTLARCKQPATPWLPQARDDNARDPDERAFGESTERDTRSTYAPRSENSPPQLS